MIYLGLGVDGHGVCVSSLSLRVTDWDAEG
jgi:hypothetical protein